MRIYLASPYSHPSERTRIWRFTQACEHAGKLIHAGHICYSPVAHSHPIASHCDLPLGWDYWKHVDLDFITNWCHLVAVLCLPGWDKSTGVLEEMRIANEIGLPVAYWNRNVSVEDLLFDWTTNGKAT